MCATQVHHLKWSECKLNAASPWMLSASLLPASFANSWQPQRWCYVTSPAVDLATSDQLHPATHSEKIASRCFSACWKLWWDAYWWGRKVFWSFSMSQAVSDELHRAGQQ